MKTTTSTQYSISSILLHVFQEKFRSSSKKTRLLKWMEVSKNLESNARNIRTVKLIAIGILISFVISSIFTVVPDSLLTYKESIIGGLIIGTFSLSLLEYKYKQRALRIFQYIHSR